MEQCIPKSETAWSAVIFTRRAVVVVFVLIIEGVIEKFIRDSRR